MFGVAKINSLAKYSAPTASWPINRYGGEIQVTGAAALNTTNKKFGTASGNFTSGGYITYKQFDAAALVSGGNYTIEFWIMLPAAVTGQKSLFTVSGGGSVSLRPQGGNVYDIEYTFEGENWNTNGGAAMTLTYGTWYHCAIVRYSTGPTTNIFFNGNRQSNRTATHTYPFTSGTSVDLLINSGQNLVYLDEVRMVNSSTIYANAATYTIPTAEFVNNANTKLLMHMNGTNGSTSFEDDATPKWQAWKDANSFDTWVSDGPYMNAAIHGVQNNQLIGTVGYTTDTSAGNYLIKGFCFDLTNKTWLWGSATTIAAKPTAAFWQTKVACQKDSQYGALLYVATSTSHAVRGYTITNYASCSSSTAPTITVGSATTLNATNNAGSGSGLVLAYTSGSRYVAGGRKSNDRLGVQGFTWNGTTLTLEGTNNEWTGAAGLGYYNTSVYLNTGTVTWGMITASSDPNRNLIEVNKGGSTGIDGAVTGYYTAKSSTNGWVVPIIDAAGSARALVVAENATDSYWTARTATATSFTTSTAPTLGTAATFGKTSGIPENTATLIPSPESGVAYLIYRSGGSNWSVKTLTVSGTTVTWGSVESVHSLNDFNIGRVPATYFSSTNGNWYLQLTSPGFTLIKLTA